MSEKGMHQARLEAAKAQAEVLKQFVPQMFSDPQKLSGGAPDSGGQDEWMLSNMPAELLVPLSGLPLIASIDEDAELFDWVKTILVGVKGINGFNMRVGENIATSLGGGGSNKKLMKRPGVMARNISNRGWQRKAEEENAEVVE